MPMSSASCMRLLFVMLGRMLVLFGVLIGALIGVALMALMAAADRSDDG